MYYLIRPPQHMNQGLCVHLPQRRLMEPKKMKQFLETVTWNQDLKVVNAKYNLPLTPPSNDTPPKRDAEWDVDILAVERRRT
jgi:hypothetical protein